MMEVRDDFKTVCDLFSETRRYVPSVHFRVDKTHQRMLPPLTSVTHLHTPVRTENSHHRYHLQHRTHSYKKKAETRGAQRSRYNFVYSLHLTDLMPLLFTSTLKNHTFRVFFLCDQQQEKWENKTVTKTYFLKCIKKKKLL